VIAQDEASSVIFGMPAEAIKTGAVDEVVDINEISAAIERRVVKFSKLVPIGA
jgi:two-component system chemotaxis response regulator CheB